MSGSTRRPRLQVDLRSAMFDVRRSLENAIRRQVSEHVSLEVHERLFRPVQQALDPVNAAIEGALREALGIPPRRDPLRAAIAELRRLLDANAKERELQRVLVESGLLDPAGTCRAVSEVSIEPADDQAPGMRMDLVVDATRDDPAQVIELKRGSHRLLVRRDTPLERISVPLARALHQVRGYGERIASDGDTRTNLEALHDLELDRLELRLVAGRRLPDAAGYHLLSQAEPGDGLAVSISSWDGFVAELERLSGR